MRRLLFSVLLSSLFAGSAHADFTIPGFELVHTSPVETTLANPDLREPVTVWSELFDAAKSEIVIAQFYAVSKPGTAFDKVPEPWCLLHHGLTTFLYCTGSSVMCPVLLRSSWLPSR